jgi:hypothetical protein
MSTTFTPDFLARAAEQLGWETPLLSQAGKPDGISTALRIFMN